MHQLNTVNVTVMGKITYMRVGLDENPRNTV